jgi:hypothetical protein
MYSHKKKLRYKLKLEKIIQNEKYVVHVHLKRNPGILSFSAYEPKICHFREFFKMRV